MTRRTKKQKGEAVPGEEEHDEPQEADSIELEDLGQLLSDRLDRKRGEFWSNDSEVHPERIDRTLHSRIQEQGSILK